MYSGHLSLSAQLLGLSQSPYLMLWVIAGQVGGGTAISKHSEEFQTLIPTAVLACPV